jgi:uncharacterized phage protein (TIGR02220 family)
VKPSEKVVYCQVDAHLDTNPKIRKAGRDGRDVFEFLLRRVAIGRTRGTVPLRYIEEEYLSEQLMMTQEEARNGVTRAVTAGLIEFDLVWGVVKLLGWSDEWGRTPKSGSERVQDWRERQKAKAPESHTSQDTTGTNRNGEALRVTDGNESNAGEEKRGEENKSTDLSGKPDAGLAFAEKAITLINRHAGTKYRPNSAAVLKLVNALIKNHHTAEQAERVIASKRAWVGDPKMGQFFRPATLLAATKFATYLDDLEAGTTATTTQAPGQQPYRQSAERAEAVSPLMLAFADGVP